MSSKRSLTHTRHARNYHKAMQTLWYAATYRPPQLGVGVGTSLIWAVGQTLHPARAWLRKTTQRRGSTDVLVTSADVKLRP